MKQIIAIVALLAVFAGGYFLWFKYGQNLSEVPTAVATFSCDQGKTIGATFYKNSVSLVLSDGRKLSVPQAISASGARYANADETFVFWNKGNTAFIEEGDTNVDNPPQTYSNCVTGGSDSSTPQDDTTTYSYPPLGFSIKYPKSYSLNQSYQYQGLVNEEIPGIKITVPASMTEGTNLSSDSGLSVEYIPNTGSSCSASLFLYGNPAATEMNDGGITYSVATATGAGAGNLYEEQVYALAGQDPCIAVRYFIHSTQLANYPEGTHVAYDRATLLAQFDAVRRSLTLKNQTQ